MMAQHFVARVTPQPRSKERKKKSGGGGWYTRVIPVLRRQRQEVQEFKATFEILSQGVSGFHNVMEVTPP